MVTTTTTATTAPTYPTLEKITRTNTMFTAPFAPKALSSFPIRSTPLEGDQRQAMLDGTSRLLDILSWRRPHGSDAELEFILEHLTPLSKHQNVSSYSVDDFGNICVTVGANPSHPLLFSCHVDTVSTKGGRQAIGWKQDEPDVICLVKKQAGRSLGADDGAGLWLLLEMIDAGQEGRYIFHRGEEVGRLGSQYIAQHTPELLDGVQACIAFDRRDHDNLITHQLGQRGCSTGFADSLIQAISQASGAALAYREDDTGSYTDSYSYFDLIPECTNLSVGYDGEHGPRETLDAAHIWRLKEAMTKADLSKLRFERDPYASQERTYGAWNYRQNDWLWDDDDACYMPAERTGGRYRTARNALDIDSDLGASGGTYDISGDLESLEDLVLNYPMKAAELLQDLGLTSWEFIEALPTSDQGRALSTIGL